MQWVQKFYEDIMRGEKRGSKHKMRPLQVLLNFITSFTENNGEHHMDTDQHDQEETLQEQKETIKPPLNLETAMPKQYLSILDGKKTTEQHYSVSLVGHSVTFAKYKG